MAGRHRRNNGHELGQTLGDAKGQRGLVCWPGINGLIKSGT